MTNFATFLAIIKNIFAWFAIAIGLPSTLLYCAEVWTILSHKPFHNSFYTLFCVRASTALVYTVLSNFYIRVPILFPEWFMRLRLPYWAVAIFTFISAYTLISDNLAMAFIMANRFTAVVLPIRHENLWRKFMAPVLLIAYGIPLYNIGTFWINIEILAVRDDQGQILSIGYVEADNGTTLNTYLALAIIFSILFLTICIPINLAILLAYRKRRKEQHKPHVGPQQPTNQLQGMATSQHRANATAKAIADMIERRLLFFAVITFFGHVLIALYLIGVYLSWTAGNFFLSNLLISQNSLVYDFGLIVLPCWLLLWASSSFRKQLLATFLPNVLYNKLFGTTLAVTIIKPPAIVPPAKSMQISSTVN